MKKAFTLVELAIVIVIIGLLVGGVLAGQELIKQAKIRSQIKKLTSVDGAIHTFFAKYNFIPGDMPAQHAQRFLGINRGGDGDGQLCSHSICANGKTGISDSQYPWFHLHASKIMSLQFPNGEPFILSSPSALGVSVYYARFREDRGGGSSYDAFGVMMLHSGDFARVYHSFAAPYGVDNKANNISISSVLPGGTHTYGTFTPDETRVIDEKLDDGNAMTGKLLGPWGAYVNSATPCHLNGIYANNDKDMLCRILYNFGL